MSHFPSSLELSFECGKSPASWSLASGGLELQSDDIHCAWWRRPCPASPPQVFTGLDAGAYVQAECDHFLEGVLWSTPCSWINAPWNEVAARRKSLQLSIAQQVGLDVPRTLITNDSHRALSFCDQLEKLHRRVVVKRVGTGSGPASKTQILNETVRQRLPTSLRTCPAIFQEYIEGLGDARVTWIDDTGIAVFIDSSAGTFPEDSRFDLTVDHVRCTIPSYVNKGLTQFMHHLGLRFGAVDFRIDHCGHWWFLEVNPSGQFLYLEDLADVPISAKFAEALARQDQKKLNNLRRNQQWWG